MRDTKGCQGIDDRVCDRRTRANGPGFTAAFGTERIDRGRRDRTLGFQGRHHGRLGHGVIHQAPGEQLAILIVDDLFVEGLRQPLRHPAVHLAIALSYWNQHRFDEAIRWANKTLELDSSHGLAREFLAGAYWAMGDFDRHMDENLKHAAAHGVPAGALEELARVYADGGRQAVLRLSLAQAARHQQGFPAIQMAR